MRKMLPTCLALATLLLAGPAFGGVVFEVETTDHQGRVTSSETSCEGKNLKMSIPSDGGRADEAIYRGDRRQLVVVNHRDEAYMVMDEKVAEQLGGQVNDQLAIAQKELQKHLGELSEEQRRGLEQALGNPQGGAGAIFGGDREPIEVRKTGERGEHQGYPCVRYDVLRGGEKIRELWVTDWSHIKGGQEVADVFNDMAAFFGDLLDSGFPGSGFEEFEALKEIDGFPVVTRSFEGGELEDETTLRGTREVTLDPDAFEPPAGYKRQEMFGGR